MFDWDEDFEAEVAPRPPIPAPIVQADPRPDAARHPWQGQGLAPLALVGVAGLGLYLWWPAPDIVRQPVSVMAFSTGAPDAGAPDPGLPVAEPVLQIYDADQAERFRRALARFHPEDLLRYAATLRRDLSLPGNPMAADLADALALTDHEIARRAAAGSR